MNAAGDAPKLETAAAAASAPGELLAQARARLDLSAADIARQLKLSVAQVEALEAGRYHQLPGPVFVRGFIRNYARLVKLDPQVLLNSLGETLPQPASRPEIPPSQDIPFPAPPHGRWRRYAAAALVALVALAAYEFFPGGVERSSPEVNVVPVELALAPAARPAAVPASADSSTGEAATAGAPAAVHSAGAPGETRDPAPAAAAGRHDERSPGRGERVVRFEFEKESWVEVRDRNGRIIFSQLNRPGTTQRVSGQPPLSVVVGNARGVRMSYDDEPVDLARHTRIDVARLTLP
jgi:cytoskeleton protein RodZ